MNNKKNSKEEVNKLKELCLKKADELAEKYPNKRFSSWDVISAVLSESSGYDVHLLTLKADLDVLKLIAEGLSASSIANRLSIPSQRIYEIANTWGMTILNSSLDFNPMYMYHDGMTEAEMLSSINDVLAIPITPQGAKSIVDNIEKYYNFMEFLEEYDDE
jgi:hypothetical protein